MTILRGNVIRSNTEDRLMDELSISGEEIFKVLPEDERQYIVEEFNSVCDDWDEDPVDYVTEFPDYVYDAWKEWLPPDYATPMQLILEVMESREEEYVHLQGGPGFSGVHTVVEVYR